MTARCLDCGKTWTSRRMEHCPACCETFSGAEAGDRHRTGSHGVSGGPDRRRCLTPAEMLAYDSGRSAKRFWRNERDGVWHFGYRRSWRSMSWVATP